jgi:2-polyprenyl-6-methoxyphenol hydroxylase-like FAD-dependent oxidoreductase
VPEAAPVLDKITDEGQLLYASYYDVVMHRFSTRNVVYLGDSAHATSPQLGQGVNLALWDAMELADALADEERDVARALERYTRRRDDHLAFYQVATRWLTPFFQGDAAWLGTLRDLAMPVMAKIPLFRRIMTLTMLGVMDGFFGKTLVLRLPG